MAEKSKRFTAYVYDNDYVEIQKLVQHYPNTETGGDLFGLWQDDKSVVIQLFIGPGKKCKRTTTSFHQDVTYLQKVGEVITKEEGLCNVGEWHSHHQIGMPHPSGADKRTVLSNMPQLGLDRFVLFIASIESSEKKKRSHSIQLKDITLRCFMFREGLHHEEQPIEGKIVQIKENNPVHLKYEARKLLAEGAEPPPKDEAVEKKKEKKRKEKEKQPPAGNQSGPPDENRSPNSGRKEKPSDQRKADVPRETTQPASPSYPPAQSPPVRSNQGQGPPRQDQYSSNQGQQRPNQGEGPPREGQSYPGQVQSPPNQGQGPPRQGQGPPRQSQPHSSQVQRPSNKDQSNSSQVQRPSNQSQGPPRQSQPHSSQVQSPPRQGQGPPRQSQPHSSQVQRPSNQGQGPPGTSCQDPTARTGIRMSEEGYF